MNRNECLKILGLPENFTTEELNSKYKDLCKKYHPDKHQGNDLQDLAEEKQKEINEAYTFLKKDLSSPSKGKNSGQAKSNKNFYNKYFFTTTFEINSHDPKKYLYNEEEEAEYFNTEWKALIKDFSLCFLQAFWAYQDHLQENHSNGNPPLDIHKKQEFLYEKTLEKIKFFLYLCDVDIFKFPVSRLKNKLIITQKDINTFISLVDPEIYELMNKFLSERDGFYNTVLLKTIRLLENALWFHSFNFNTEDSNEFRAYGVSIIENSLLGFSLMDSSDLNGYYKDEYIELYKKKMVKLYEKISSPLLSFKDLSRYEYTKLETMSKKFYNKTSLCSLINLYLHLQHDNIENAREELLYFQEKYNDLLIEHPDNKELYREISFQLFGLPYQTGNYDLAVISPTTLKFLLHEEERKNTITKLEKEIQKVKVGYKTFEVNLFKTLNRNETEIKKELVEKFIPIEIQQSEYLLDFLKTCTPSSKEKLYNHLPFKELEYLLSRKKELEKMIDETMIQYSSKKKISQENLRIQLLMDNIKTFPLNELVQQYDFISVSKKNHYSEVKPYLDFLTSQVTRLAHAHELFQKNSDLENTIVHQKIHQALKEKFNPYISTLENSLTFYKRHREYYDKRLKKLSSKGISHFIKGFLAFNIASIFLNLWISIIVGLLVFVFTEPGIPVDLINEVKKILNKLDRINSETALLIEKVRKLP